MEFHLVRSSETGCEPNCPEWISAEGQIVQGAAAKFEQFVAKLGDRRPPILFTSPGGSINDALVMGRLIRKKHFATVVASTFLIPCVAPARCADSEGVPYAFGVCASACTILFAGGETRYAFPATYLGVHQSQTYYTHTRVYRQYQVEYRIVNGVKQEISRTQIGESRTQTTSKAVAVPAVESEVSAYFKEMGIGPKMTALIEATPPSAIHWMTASEIEATGLVTRWIDKFKSFVSSDGAISSVAVAPVAGSTRTPSPDASPGLMLLARGEWPFALPVAGRALTLSAEFSFHRGDDSVGAALETHFLDRSLDALFGPEVRGRGFTIRFDPTGDPYQVLKTVAGGPLQTTAPLAAFCKLRTNGQIVIEPFDGPATNINETQATANPHEPPIVIAAASIMGMPALLRAACGNAAASIAAKP